MSSLIVSVSRPSAVAIAAGLPTEVVLTRTIVTLAGGGGGAVTASAVSIADTGALYAATDVEAALAEVRTVADTAAGGGVTLEQVQDDLGTTSLVAGTSLSKVYDDSAGTITLDVDTADFATAAQGALADTATQPGDLGTAATTAATDYATAAQGALADTATQPGDLATVATTGAYADVTGTPTLGTAAAADTGDFATGAEGDLASTAVQPGDLGTAATTAATDYATAAQGALADTATQPGDLGTAATTAATDYATAAQGATADTALQSVDVPADMTATGTADGTTFLRGDGVWATPPGAGGGISNVVDDVTPQLGGTLDTNGQTITDASDGTVTVDDNLDVVGNITVSGTVDGRDVATDGTKLDGVETAATADQTGAQIKVAYEAELDTNAFTDAEQSKLAGVETAADVTDTANVTAAGALMDSEVDANLKTLALPASTTISAYGATLVDDADAATARTTLELGTAATTAATDYATAAQGATADTATQPGDLGTAAAADTGDFATAAQGTLADTAVQPGTINAQTGTTYTFALSDAGDVVTCDNASAVTATVPPNASVAFPVGSRIEVIGIGAGIVTIAEGAGVTVNATPSLVFRAQHSGCTLIKIATDTWQAVGDFA